MYHAPVLLRETIEALLIEQDGCFVDATFGGGGHSGALLEALGPKGRLYSFDQDLDAAQNAKQAPFAGDARFTFIHSNFRFIQRQLRSEGVRPGSVSGIMADLGVSSYQLDTPERGFSYRFDAELDMRMNPTEGQTAADILNTYSADELQRVFGELGEVRNARTLAKACIDARATRPFNTTGELNELCEKLAMGERMRYRSQVFQALRMEVNDELGALEAFLIESLQMLAPGGRLAVITFHSLEDRMVKNFFKSGNVSGELNKDFYGNISRPMEQLTRKPIEASDVENRENPRARSAKLRVAIKNR